MSIRLLKIFALALAVALALTGCNLVTVDETLDDETVVATFTGGTVTKGEMKLDYQYYLSLYAMYGYTGEDAEVYLRELATSSIAQNKILLNKAAELGLDTLTAEEDTSVKEKTETDYQEYVDQSWEQFAEAGLTDDEIRSDVEAYLVELGMGYDDVLKANTDAVILEHLRDSVYETVVLTEAEIQAKYDALVSEDETAYASLSTFETDMTSGGADTYWFPEGYRTVKQILLAFTDEQKADLADYDAQITAKQTELDELNALLAAAPVDDEADEAEPKTNETAENLQKDIDAIKAAKGAKTAEFVGLLQTKVDEINARLANGEDFDALMAEYGEDTGMQQEPGMTQGYYVSAASTSWVASFTEAAMALEKVGDVSEPAVSDFGLHIIRYNSDVTPGAVPFDTVSDKVRETALTEKQTAAYETARTEWVEAANVKYDFSKF